MKCWPNLRKHFQLTKEREGEGSREDGYRKRWVGVGEGTEGKQRQLKKRQRKREETRCEEEKMGGMEKCSEGKLSLWYDSFFL